MRFAAQTSAQAESGSSWRQFPDRSTAGALLAERLDSLSGLADAVVLGLPRGGLPVARAVAERLGLPLDVFVVRKLGVPGHEELAFGALASGGTRVLNDDVIGETGLSRQVVDRISEREGAELAQRERLYRGTRPRLDLTGRTAILVDDGLATGSTMRAAVQASRAAGADRVIVAVPVAPAEACDELSSEADEVVCLRTPQPFYAVGMWYAEFDPVSDEEVRRILEG